jgi:hypothetical protein
VIFCHRLHLLIFLLEKARVAKVKVIAFESGEARLHHVNKSGQQASACGLAIMPASQWGLLSREKKELKVGSSQRFFDSPLEVAAVVVVVREGEGFDRCRLHHL